MKAIMSWSSGKDSAWALHKIQQEGKYDVLALLTTLNATHGRVAMHAVRRELLQAQARALDLKLWEVDLPWPCSNQEYEQIMSGQITRANQQGVTHMIFGDLFLEDIRAYREQRLFGTGITPVFPLWKRPTRELALEMIEGGLVAHLTAVDPAQLDGDFVGRRFDRDLLDALPAGVDPCGENGEFHTFVSEAPVFRGKVPVRVRVGEKVQRDGFWFCDLTGERADGVGKEDE